MPQDGSPHGDTQEVGLRRETGPSQERCEARGGGQGLRGRDDSTQGGHAE